MYLIYSKENKLIWIIKAKTNLKLLMNNGLEYQSLNLLWGEVNRILGVNNK